MTGDLSNADLAAAVGGEKDQGIAPTGDILGPHLRAAREEARSCQLTHQPNERI
jgi:hypothetical protein